VSVKVLGIYGSPRKGGNTDLILDKILEGSRTAGAEINSIYVRQLKIDGCLECGSCDDTGKCVIQDDMQSVYPLLQQADIIFLASPNFFYNVTAQVKLLIDRSQAMWSARLLEKPPERRRTYDSGKGYLICIGATKGCPKNTVTLPRFATSRHIVFEPTFALPSASPDRAIRNLKPRKENRT